MATQTKTTNIKTIEEIRALVKLNPIRVWRRGEEITVLELALMVGTTEWTINKYESGAMRPKGATLEKLKKIIGDDIEQKIDDWYAQVQG